MEQIARGCPANEPITHPYIPNSAPEIRAAMLAEIGVASTEELYASIPTQLRAPEQMGLPPALRSEPELRRYFMTEISKNIDTTEYLSFLGGGCWAHAVPAVCDEIAGRGEFWSACIGMGGASTSGAYQALFEYQSLIGELVGLDLTALPTYDWAWAAGQALLMAVRATGRSRLLLADTIGPNRRRQIAARLPDGIQLDLVAHDPVSGAIDLADLRLRLDGAAALYFENPSYLGILEPELDSVRQITADGGCLLIAGVDPISLGAAREPGSYGADMACGELQPLGHHMTYGGSTAGFLSCRFDERLITELPSVYVVAVPTLREGEYDFFLGNFETTSYATRGQADDVIGSASIGAGIASATYLSLLGPAGMRELGDGLRTRLGYLAERLSAIPGVRTSRLTGLPFKELIVDFSGTGRAPDQINRDLLERAIFGGLPLESDFPELKGCALFSVTELHTRDDLDRLAAALEEILQ
ncbi:aminomethyl-transferring glycine dehydrogenase subunit GcvPA [Mesorhizobium sp. B2-4-19]|uniref:aminomethyl-transferring glycine dehydrogenase subunit GcvPA n=1 Tax=Mesorhizobium sp. B2-4-19 TaxID=2589930 RepID=UPI00112A60A2|nr:aminomethyl-transferring glycine dehydrogenase subunit GcvPA [Mesorhizobium sp. B2-4-19]TPK65607.1 aminomethyl-transferring glycine dehydrogenase subunit GcvPA [Mesorhizobium sp. B2-4-19]